MIPPTVHATCVVVGGVGILIRGPSGSGKTTLGLALIDDALVRGLPAALVADDRVVLEAEAGTVVGRAPPALAGLVELRGRGVVPEPVAPSANIRLVVDLVPAMDLPRLPEPAELTTAVAGEPLVRQPVPTGDLLRALILVRRALAALR